MNHLTKPCRDTKELNKIAQQACELFLAQCKKGGIDIFITETYRSQERQNYLYDQGRTRKGQIVTWTRNSNHTSRMAWDIAVSPPKDLYDPQVLAKAGKIAKSLDIEWGGNWQPPDKPHFQIDQNWQPPKGEKQVNKIKIRLNEVSKEVHAIMDDGHYYVKLRDLADGYIAIDYDYERKMPIVKVI